MDQRIKLSGVGADWFQLPEDHTRWPSMIFSTIGRQVPEITNYITNLEFQRIEPTTGEGEATINLINSPAVIPIVIKDFRLAPMDTLYTREGDFLPLNESTILQIYATPEIAAPVKNTGSGDLGYEGTGSRMDHIGSGIANRPNKGAHMYKSASYNQSKTEYICEKLLLTPASERKELREKIASDRLTHNLFREKLATVWDALSEEYDNAVSDLSKSVGNHVNSSYQTENEFVNAVNPADSLFVLNQEAGEYVMNGVKITPAEIHQLVDLIGLSPQELTSLRDGDPIILDQRSATIPVIHESDAQRLDKLASDSKYTPAINPNTGTTDWGIDTEDNRSDFGIGTVYYGGLPKQVLVVDLMGCGLSRWGGDSADGVHRKVTGDESLNRKSHRVLIIGESFHSYQENAQIDNYVPITNAQFLTTFKSITEISPNVNYMKVHMYSPPKVDYLGELSKDRGGSVSITAPFKALSIEKHGIHYVATIETRQKATDAVLSPLDEQVVFSSQDRFYKIPEQEVTLRERETNFFENSPGTIVNIGITPDGKIKYLDKYVNKDSGIYYLMKDLGISTNDALQVIQDIQTSNSLSIKLLSPDYFVNSMDPQYDKTAAEKDTAKKPAASSAPAEMNEEEMLRQFMMQEQLANPPIEPNVPIDFASLPDMAKLKDSNIMESYMAGVLSGKQTNISIQEIQEVAADINELVKSLSKLLFKVRIGENSDLEEVDITLAIRKLSDISKSLGSSMVESFSYTGSTIPGEEAMSNSSLASGTTTGTPFGM